jgi:hypothetical protein
MLNAWFSIRNSSHGALIGWEAEGTHRKLALIYHAMTLLEDADWLARADRVMSAMPVIRAAFETVTAVILLRDRDSYASWLQDESKQDRLTEKAGAIAGTLSRSEMAAWAQVQVAAPGRDAGPFDSRSSQMRSAYPDGERGYFEYRALTSLCHPSVRLADLYITRNGDDCTVRLAPDELPALNMTWIIYMCLQTVLAKFGEMTNNQTVLRALMDVGYKNVAFVDSLVPEEPSIVDAQTPRPKPGPPRRRQI